MPRPIPAASLAAVLLLVPPVAIAQTQCSLAPASGPAAPQTSLPANAVAAAPDPNPARGLVEFPAADVARLPALRNVANAGAKLYELPTPPGLEGLRTVFAVNGSAFQVFYVPPHGAAVIRGIAQGPGGENLTLAQTSAIPGVVPAIDIREGAALVDGSAVKTTAAATYGLWGREGAPRVYMVVDPLCSFSLRAMTTLKPAIDAGRLQLAVVPVAVTDGETGGHSTPAALAMLSVAPRDDMALRWMADWRAWAGQDPSNPQPADAYAALRRNTAAAKAIGLRGTPTFLWAKPDGSDGRMEGAPADLNGLLAVIGG